MIKVFWLSIVLAFFLSYQSVFSQAYFKFKDEDKRAVNLRLTTINNLMVLMGKLNGEPVNFLLDTGVNKTKIFAKALDSTFLEDTEFVYIRSLGSEKPVKAYKTSNNVLDFAEIVGRHQEVYYITDPRFDLARKLGINVQGILGYDFLSHFIFRLDYSRNKLRVYQHDKFNRKLWWFDEICFRLFQNKPHLQLPVQFLNGFKQELVFLIDTGSSDAFWVFEKENISAPDNAFFDYVGYGLENAVEGKRSKTEAIRLGEFTIEQPKTAFIDASSAELFTADTFKDGILGGEVLKRFVTFLDYKNRKIYFKPNSSFKDNFNYDRSGLYLTYTGEEINTIKTPVMVSVDDKDQGGYSAEGVESKFEIRVEVFKILEITDIRPQSPAAEVDIQVGDRLLKINGSSIQNLSLDKIQTILSSEEGKRIKVHLRRGKREIKRSFRLRSRLSN
jgi:hypothetical protein